MSILHKGFCLILLFSYLLSCKPELNDLPEVETFGPETEFRTEVKYIDTTALRTIVFEGGIKPSPGLSTNYVFTGAEASVGELGNTLIIAGTQVNLIAELYFLQFWIGDLPIDRLWTAIEIEDFFTIGRSFDFGSGEGKVDLGIALPPRGSLDDKLSRPSYLATPLGTLIVERIEDYDYPVYSLFFQSSQRSYGKLITCSFSGQIGRYDGLADEADGAPNFYQTDEVVELINGEVTFYIEYERI